MEPAGPCGFCPAAEAQPARYTCPRCNAPYCSLRCYRTHGTCAENFYRDQLPNVLFAYAHTLALYHGGDDALLSDFCATLLGVSGALGAQQVFASAEEALQAAAHVLEAGEHPPGPLGTRGAMHEVARILLGEGPTNQKGYTLAALGDLAQTLGRARKQAVAREERDHLYRARKKCQFLLAWTNENE
ncbi:ZNHIT2 isoform 2, partial [Pongo abelii]